MQLVEERGQVSRVMCQERRADGRQCRYPAEEGGAMCRAHTEWKASPLAALPFPDDALGLQRLMAKLLSGLLYGGMDPQKARVAADVCRTMRQNIEGYERAAREAEEEFFLQKQLSVVSEGRNSGPSGAEARIQYGRGAAWLKPCPDTNDRRAEARIQYGPVRHG
ncbi:MAG TPA: hypothetical protein VGQ94_00245 [Terriglobales bacterium]|nr:hypothetical protein [Terriglobales bacterium]